MKGIHNIHKMTASIAAVLLSASLFSCSSDDFFGKAEGTEGISFGVTDAAETRAANVNDAKTVAHYVLRTDASADTLCVRAIVTDGIGNNDNKPMTRFHNASIIGQAPTASSASWHGLQRMQLSRLYPLRPTIQSYSTPLPQKQKISATSLPQLQTS